MLVTLLYVAFGTLFSVAVLWLACRNLEEASHQLARHYRVPDIVKGSLLTAVSSSFPELMTAILAISVHGDFELGLSAIVGSAIYNILVIPAASVMTQGAPLRSNRELVYREAQFYLVSVTALLLVISLAVIYRGSGMPADSEAVVIGDLNRWLASILLVLYGLYLFIQYEEIKDHRGSQPVTSGVRPLREWSRLIASTLAVAAGVEILLRAALTLGDLLQTPTFLWGMTIVAAATSIPDMLISIQAAHQRRHDSSISNVLGSNVFDLLVAVPIGVLIAGTVPVNFTQTVPMMTFLMVATVVMLVFMRRDMEITMPEALIMLALYLGFGLWMASEAFGLTDVLGLPVG